MQRIYISNDYREKVFKKAICTGLLKYTKDITRMIYQNRVN